MQMVEKAVIRLEVATSANPENYDFDRREYDEGAVAASENLLYILDHNIPSVEAEPVRHGRWVKYWDFDFAVKYKCSECGREVMVPMCSKDPVRKVFPYCHCGAKMDEEE